MSSSSSIPHDRMYAYKASIFSGFVASSPPIGNTNFYFLLLYFPYLSMSTVFPSSIILDGDLPAPQFWPDILCRWIITFFSSTLIFLLPPYFMFSFFPCIDTGNETRSSSDVLGASLALCVTIISSLNCYPRSPLTREFFSVIVESLII